MCVFFSSFFFSSRRRHTRWTGDWSSDVCSSDLVHQRAESVRADQQRAAPEYAGVEEPHHGHERRVVRAVEADLAQIAARARESRRRADLVRHGLEARVRLPLAFRAQVIGEALPGRVVAVAVNEAGIAAPLDLDRARRRERHLALRERELLRLRVGGAERKTEALQTDRGHAGRGLWNRIIFYSTKGLGASPGTGRDAQVSP